MSNQLVDRFRQLKFNLLDADARQLIGARVALLAFLLIIFTFLIPIVSAQQPANSDAQAQPEPAATPVSESDSDSQSRKANTERRGSMVRIGPGDELDIAVFGLPELSQHVRVSGSGDVSVPLVGTLHFSGLTSDEAQTLLEKLLADGHYVNNPHVSVYVKEYTTEGISVVGEVARPGVYPALGAHRLLDVIQAAGGLTEKAGRIVTVSHRADPTAPITLTFSDDAVRMGQNNVDVIPGDTIVVSKAGIVYVVGEVNRPGGFIVEGNKLMASQLLAMAAGPTRMASLNRARIIRRTPDGLKEIPLPLARILQAKTPDITLQVSDIIYVPESRSKGIIGASNIVSLLASLAIYKL